MNACLGSHTLEQTRTLRSTLLFWQCYHWFPESFIYVVRRVCPPEPPQTARMLPHTFQGSPSTATWTTEAARWKVKQVAATVNLCSQKKSVILSVQKCTSVLCNRYQKSPQDYSLMCRVAEPRQTPDSNLVTDTVAPWSRLWFNRSQCPLWGYSVLEPHRETK